MKKTAFIVLPLVFIMMMACSLVKNADGSPTGQGPIQPENTPPVNTPLVNPPIQDTPVPPDPVPVSINDGLNSLNSYQLTVIFKSFGPDPATSSTINIQRQRSIEANSSYTHINMSGTNKDGSEP